MSSPPKPLDPTLHFPFAHPCRAGKPEVKMMTPVRYIFLALFIIVRGRCVYVATAG